MEVVKQYQKGFSKEAAGLQNAQYVVLDFAKASSCQTGVNNLERAGQPLDRSTVFRNSIKRHEQVSSLIGLKPGYDQARPSALYFEQIVAKKTSQDRFNSLDNGCYQLGYASGGSC